MEEVLDGGSEEEIAEQGNGGFFLKGKLGFLEIFCFSHHRLHSIGQSINVTSSFFSKKIEGDKSTPEKILWTVSYGKKNLKFENFDFYLTKLPVNLASSS